MKPPWKRNASKRELGYNGDEENHSTAFLTQSQSSGSPASVKATSHIKLCKHFVAEFPMSKHLDNSNSPCVSVMDEEISKDEAKRPLPEQTKKLWRKAAIWITVACVIVSLSLTMASSLSAKEFDSTSAMALAFDCANAVLCTPVLLWRFMLKDNGILGYKREKIACLVFAFSFTASGVLTIALSIQKLMENVHAVKTLTLIIILSVGFVLYCSLAALQFLVSRKLRSSAMLSSSFDSGMSAGLIMGLLISSFAYEFSDADLWYLDHTMAIIVSIVSITAGAEIFIQALIYKTLPMEISIT